MITVERDGALVLPGLATAHSHAFQRVLRGHTQWTDRGSFWSWRELMYRVADRLSPELLYDLSHYAFVELALTGVTAVGEFHYVHHDRNGAPYSDRNELAKTVIRAARDAGLRISLLRVLYNRAGAGAPPTGAQRRFADDDLDTALADVDDLVTSFADDDRISIGIAPHSIRAVPIDWVDGAAKLAGNRDLPLHMHVAEQPREIEECMDEHGSPPVRLLAERGLLSSRFVAVHATHLERDEIDALGSNACFVCLCRTTERDLGDGLAPSGELSSAGARLCVGIDSHAITDPFEELRAVELDDRSRLGARHVVAAGTGLLTAATVHGYSAIGLDARGDEVELDGGDPALAGWTPEHIDDAIVFAGHRGAVRRVQVAGSTVVEDGHHPGYERARERFDRAVGDVL